MTDLTSFFLIWKTFISFCCLTTVTRATNTIWIKVLRVSILVLLQGPNEGLSYCRQILYCLSYQGSLVYFCSISCYFPFFTSYLVIWVLSLFFLISMARIVLFVYLKKHQQTLVHFYYYFFYLSSFLTFIISFLLLTSSFVCSFLSNYFRWWFIWDLSYFLRSAFIAINFPSGTDFPYFIDSVMLFSFSFVFVMRYFLISSLVSKWTYHFTIMLFFLWLTYSFIPLWSEKMLEIISTIICWY